jgi:hypothetical protein
MGDTWSQHSPLPEIERFLMLQYTNPGQRSRYGEELDGPRFESRQEQDFFFFSKTVQTSSGSHPAYLVGTRDLSLDKAAKA